MNALLALLSVYTTIKRNFNFGLVFRNEDACFAFISPVQRKSKQNFKATTKDYSICDDESIWFCPQLKSYHIKKETTSSITWPACLFQKIWN
jgi:hypothetical protein